MQHNSGAACETGTEGGAWSDGSDPERSQLEREGSERARADIRIAVIHLEHARVR